jgi:heat shock protein HtpX
MPDHVGRVERRRGNAGQSLLLAAGIGSLLAIATALVWGPLGVLLAALAAGALVVAAPRVRPGTIMRLYRARPVDPHTGDQLIALASELSGRAGLAAAPRLFVIPSTALNAFAVGTPERSAIALTEGLLRRLTLREIAGVLAHEIAHIRANDLEIMGLADVTTRFAQFLSYLAVLLALVNLLLMVRGEDTLPWLSVALLYLAPAATSLLQLALSRAREFQADLEAAHLTGDALGLASALRRLDSGTGHILDDFCLPVPCRRVAHPSLLRSHPPAEERIDRLVSLEGESAMPPLAIVERPMVSLAGFGPILMRPRYRWPGIWY